MERLARTVTKEASHEEAQVDDLLRQGLPALTGIAGCDTNQHEQPLVNAARHPSLHANLRSLDSLDDRAHRELLNI